MSVGCSKEANSSGRNSGARLKKSALRISFDAASAPKATAADSLLIVTYLQDHLGNQVFVASSARTVLATPCN